MTRKLCYGDEAIKPRRTLEEALDWPTVRNRSEARDKSPYQVGDVIKFLDFDTARDALILGIGTELIKLTGEYIPVYRVRSRRKDGEFARAYRFVYPGDIDRGYERMKADKKPVCMEGGEDCDPATRPDPRFPKLEEGNEVLCEGCYQAALDEMAEDVENQR